MNRRLPVFALGALALAAGSAALAHSYRAGALTIDHPWARETAPAQSVGGGFLSVANRGATEDRLLAASSPVAAQVQLHTMSMDGAVMRMRQVTGGIAIPAHGTLELRPGGFHIMFIGLKRPLRQGERVPATLRFARAGRVNVEFAVQAVTATGAPEAAHAGH